MGSGGWPIVLLILSSEANGFMPSPSLSRVRTSDFHCIGGLVSFPIWWLESKEKFLLFQEEKPYSLEVYAVYK